MRLEEKMISEELRPEYFFDLSSFAHSEIFKRVDYVWEALRNIGKYIREYGDLSRFRQVEEGVYIGENTIIEPNAVIIGPTIIGDNCEIRSGSYIRGNVIIGNNCILRSEIKNSVIMNGSHAAHLSYIGDSIIGSNCNLGAGTVLANLRLDKGEIEIEINGKKYKTNLNKFGAILGDYSQTSCNVVTSPGTLIGKHSWLTCNYGGFIESDKFVKMRREIVESKNRC